MQLQRTECRTAYTIYLCIFDRGVHRHFASSVPLTLISSKAQEFARCGFHASDRLVSTTSS